MTCVTAHRKARILSCAIMIVSTWMTTCIAAGPDAAVIQRITRIQPEVKDGVVKVNVPRTDLHVVVDGTALAPFQGLTTWAAFQAAGAQTMVMGDMTLTEAQVSPALTAALENGLEVTALHNHFAYDQPRIYFMHIGGLGTTEALATGVKRTLDAADAAKASPEGRFAGPPIPSTSTIDPKPLEAALGASAQAKDGMAKFVFAKATRMHGVEAGAAMGVNTWATFAGSPDAAVVDGDFAMLETELQGVLKALRKADINIVAIHHHMAGETPRYLFLHYWGRGSVESLTRGLKAALDTQPR